jgi:hypothetical protein
MRRGIAMASRLPLAALLQLRGGGSACSRAAAAAQPLAAAAACELQQASHGLPSADRRALARRWSAPAPTPPHNAAQHAARRLAAWPDLHRGLATGASPPDLRVM